MCSQYILLCFCFLPLILVAFGAVAALLMNLFGCFHIFLGHTNAILWALDEEGIVHVSCWVTLRLEKCVEVPERTLDISVCWHFFEAHTQEDFFELLTNLHERMAMASMTHWSLSVEIVFLEGFIFPVTCP